MLRAESPAKRQPCGRQRDPRAHAQQHQPHPEQRDAEQAAALKRAQADAERYRRSVPYADPFWPYRSYPFGYPYPHPRFAPYGGFGWGIQIRP